MHAIIGALCSVHTLATLLVTGGAGFVGSHTCTSLAEEGHDIVIIDNFSNSSPHVLKRIGTITGKNMKVIKGDIRDKLFLEHVFTSLKSEGTNIDAVIHFAGLKSVAESVANPLLYWDVNVCGTKTLLEVMSQNKCHTIVFSSTSTVYGSPTTFPLSESSSTNPIHPYSQSKLAVEYMINSLAKNGIWKVCSLRYFNPVGAHNSGEIGEDPKGTPNNLFPYITQVAIGIRPFVKVYGSDYPTPDGSGVRDYLHIMDLAESHCAALSYLLKSECGTSKTFNIGTGKGLSVLEIIREFELVTDVKIPFELVGRRRGDVACLIASSELAYKELGWKARRNLTDMCRDGWRWQTKNPRGYG